MIPRPLAQRVPGAFDTLCLLRNPVVMIATTEHLWVLCGGRCANVAAQSVATADASTGSALLSLSSVPWGEGNEDVGAWRRVRAAIPRELEARR